MGDLTKPETHGKHTHTQVGEKCLFTWKGALTSAADVSAAARRHASSFSGHVCFAFRLSRMGGEGGLTWKSVSDVFRQAGPLLHSLVSIETTVSLARGRKGFPLGFLQRKKKNRWCLLSRFPRVPAVYLINQLQVSITQVFAALRLLKLVERLLKLVDVNPVDRIFPPEVCRQRFAVVERCLWLQSSSVSFPRVSGFVVAAERS